MNVNLTAIKNKYHEKNATFLLSYINGCFS